MIWHMGDGWGWWMIFGVVFMAAFWLIVIWAIGSLGQRPPADSGSPRRHDSPTALEILERRYASGELTDEEFQHKRRLLAASGPGDRRDESLV